MTYQLLAYTLLGAIYVLACLQLPARSRAFTTESPTTLRLFATAPELCADRASSVFDVAVAYFLEFSMTVGTVKWFNPTKGFGFIQPEGSSKDVFVHISAVEKSGMGSLAEGQQVSFDIVTERGKQAAANLKSA